MTNRDNIIYYTITAVVFIGIMLCFLLFHNSGQVSNSSDKNEVNQSVIAKINQFAPIIEALSVFGSFGFVIWATCFRKTRRDRIDELKTEMQVLLSGKTGHKFFQNSYRDDINVVDAKNEFFNSLEPKFQKRKYKVLYRCAYDELTNEGKNNIVNLRRTLNQATQESHERLRESYWHRIPK